MAKTRSPNYPAISLREAIDLVSKLHQAEGRSPVDAYGAVSALGYQGLSGASRTKLSGLRKFGLVEDTTAGLRVSDLAMAILRPRTPDEERAALRTAATTPTLFRDLAEYPDASDGNLVNRLMREGFTESGAKLAVASYRETMSLAPDGGSEHNGVDDETPDVLAPASAAGFGIPPTNTDQASHAISISLPGGARADLRITGRVTADGVKLVEDYLNLIKASIQMGEASGSADASSPTDPDASAPLLLSGQSPDDAPDSAS